MHFRHCYHGMMMGDCIFVARLLSWRVRNWVFPLKCKGRDLVWYFPALGYNSFVGVPGKWDVALPP